MMTMMNNVNPSIYGVRQKEKIFLKDLLHHDYRIFEDDEGFHYVLIGTTYSVLKCHRFKRGDIHSAEVLFPADKKVYPIIMKSNETEKSTGPNLILSELMTRFVRTVKLSEMHSFISVMNIDHTSKIIFKFPSLFDISNNFYRYIATRYDCFEFWIVDTVGSFGDKKIRVNHEAVRDNDIMIEVYEITKMELSSKNE